MASPIGGFFGNMAKRSGSSLSPTKTPTESDSDSLGTLTATRYAPLIQVPVKLGALEVAMDAPYISRDPEIMSGAPCFKGTRVLVQNLFDYLEGSSSLEDFLEDFPSVSREAAIAVLEAAKARLFADAPAA